MMSALERFAQRKQLPIDFVLKLGLRDDALGIRIEYGNDGRARIRKDVESAQPTYWAQNDNRPMRVYGHHLAPKMATKANKTLLIVEGESDSLTAWLHKQPALGVPGATMAHTIQNIDVQWAHHVLIVREPDVAGDKFVLSVAERLREVKFTGDVSEITLNPYKDTSDLHVALQGAHEGFIAALNDAIAGARSVRVSGTAKTEEGDLLTFNDLARECSEQVDWLVDGLIRRSGILLMSSQPKVGKSDTARNLAKAVATGGNFLGRSCQKGKVIWIGLEEPVSHLHDRLEVMGMQDLDITYRVKKPPGDETAWLRSMVEKHRPALLLIDTVGRFSNIDSINDYSQVKRATQPILDMRAEFGTTFVLLHHNNRYGDKPIGSTMWEAVVDTILIITMNDNGIRFARTKQRSGVDMEPATLTMNHDTGEITCIEPKFITDRRVAEQRILQYLETVGKPLTREELATHSGRSSAVGRAAVDALSASGLIRSSGDGTKRNPRLYSLVSPPTSSNSSSNGSANNSRTYIAEESEEYDPAPARLTEASRGKANKPEESEEPEEPEEPDATDLLGYARKVFGD
jgi:hypothetical protein